MIYNTNDGPPEKPVQPPVVGSALQTHYFPQRPMPPVVQQQPPNIPPGAVPVEGGGYQFPRQQQQFPPNGYPMMQQNVVVQCERRGTNHGLHIILSLLTAGLWVPVWLLIWAVRGR